MQVYKNEETLLDQVVKKLEQNDSTFTELDLQKAGYKVIRINTNQGDSFELTYYDDEILLKIAAAIKANKTLKKFISAGVSRYYFNSRVGWTYVSAQELGNALKDHPALEEIHLSFDEKEWIPEKHLIKMTSAEMSGIFQALSGPKVKVLSLTADLTNDLINCLTESITPNTTLKSITILPSDTKQNDIYEDATLLAFAAGFAGKSLQHLNLELRLNHATIKVLSEHLSEINTLKTINLNKCNITHTDMTFIASILNKNPHVTYLDLSGNPLGLEGIKSLASALPNLPHLKTLVLNNTNLDDKALEELDETWQIYNLKIRTLEIGMHDYNEAYIAAVKKIIENNGSLDNLIMKGDKFKKEHFYLLQNLLQDPNKCRLRKFVFESDLVECDADFHSALIGTLKKNPHFIKLDPLYSSQVPTNQSQVRDLFQKKRSLTTAWGNNIVNQKNSQQDFVERVILLCALHSSPPENPKKPNIFSLLPREVFLVFLYQIGLQNAFGRSDEDIVQCVSLIFDNFSERKKLMNQPKEENLDSKLVINEQKKINPDSKLKLSEWWSLSSRGTNPKQIFRLRNAKDSKPEVNQGNSGSPTLQG